MARGRTLRWPPPLVRLLLFCAFLVGVAAICYAADLRAWAIIVVIAAAWLVTALAERAASRPAAPAVEDAAPAAEVAPEPEPEPVAEALLDGAGPAEPHPEPEPERPPEAPAEEPATGGPRHWNLWELERIARASAGADDLQDAEWSALLMELRQFATADGNLPLDFDPLVRESFGELIASAERS